MSERADRSFEELLRQAQTTKSRDDFDLLLTAISPFLFKVAVGRVGNDNDADDVTNQALLRVFKKIDFYDRDRPARPWLFVIVRHLASEFIRRRPATRRHVELTDIVEAACESPIDELERAEEIQILYDAVEELPEIEEQYLLLCYWEGKSHSKVQRILNLTRSKGSRLYLRALEKLGRSF